MLAALVAAASAGVCTDAPEPARASEAAAAYRQGVGHVQAERWAEAASAFETALGLDGGLPLAHYGLGQARMAQKRYAEAVDAFSHSRDAFVCAGQMSPEARHEAGRRLDEEIDSLRESIRHLEKDRLVKTAVRWQEVNGTPPRPLGESGRALHEMERRLAQLERLKVSGWTSRPPPELSLALGSALFQIGALGDAEREFKTALEADPESGDALNNLAVVFMLTERLDEAERAVKGAEKAGVTVNPRLKEEIRKRRAASPPR